MRMKMLGRLFVGCAVAMFAVAVFVMPIEGICPEKMQAVFDEVKTPFKYGMILEPPCLVGF